ncbi:MAG: hypothetical protein K0S58_2543 [Nitrospira sp.]|jgi:hypothetical protein|nr:hypothetical protein [Nitrospira sp.]
MPARKTLYLLRQPVVDSAASLLPSVATTESTGRISLVLLEKAVQSQPSFPGQVYVLQSVTDSPLESGGGKNISYPDLVALIAEHDAIIVL